VHRRCKCPLYVPERKLGIMRCLDWPGAAHTFFVRLLGLLLRPARAAPPRSLASRPLSARRRSFFRTPLWLCSTRACRLSTRIVIFILFWPPTKRGACRACAPC